MNYTKGSWKCERVFPENASREEYHVTDGKWGGETVAICGGNQENALLIAAAPDMYEALRNLVDCAGLTWLDGYKSELDAAMRAAHAALNKTERRAE